MQVLVINGSPSGKNSITLQTALFIEKHVKLTWINPRASICGSRRRAALGGRTNAPADTPSA